MNKGTGHAVAVSIAAAVVVVAGAAPWLSAGGGSSVSGFALAGLVRGIGDQIEGVPPSLAGLAFYAVPLLGLAIWLAVWARPRPTWGITWVLGAGVLVLTAGFSITALAYDGTPGWGALVAVAASLVVVVAAWPFGSSAVRTAGPDHF